MKQTKESNELRRLAMTKHGHSSKYGRSPEYRVWLGMCGRCANPNHPKWSDYGGRKITVCRRWRGTHGFARFLADLGPRPVGYTLERVDNNKSYTPSNCVWASRKTQARNRRDNVIITHGGYSLCLSEWAEKYNLNWKTLHNRLYKLKWAVVKALTTPPRKRKSCPPSR